MIGYIPKIVSLIFKIWGILFLKFVSFLRQFRLTIFFPICLQDYLLCCLSFICPSLPLTKFRLLAASHNSQH